MLVYKFDVMEELKKRYKQSELKKAGIAGSTLTKLYNGDMVGPKALDDICRILGKQPGSIIKWVPDPVEDLEK